MQGALCLWANTYDVFSLAVQDTGALFMSTISKTELSHAIAIVAAERVLNMVGALWVCSVS